MSVALYGEQLIAEIIVDAKGRQPLLQAVDDLFLVAEKKKSDLTGIAYSKGPGAFTGLRVGLATAKGIAFALKLPIVGVSTLHAFAKKYQSQPPKDVVSQPLGHLVAPLLDAKKGEIYGALYQQETELLAPCALPAESLAEKLTEAAQGRIILCVGDGATLLTPMSNWLILPQLSPCASEITAIGAKLLSQGISDDLTAATPTYLRLPEAVVKAAKTATSNQ
jgi:tRNA threonylcarbamoyladenosine biosynthesis protein TsaB